jgi:hypothetical protein
VEREPEYDLPHMRLSLSAAQDVDDEARAEVSASDLALLSGHPAGLSPRRAVGRLSTALWEVFPAHVALLDRDGVILAVNRAWREFALSSGGSPTAELGSNYVEVCRRSAATGEPEAREAADLVCDALRGRDPGRRLPYACEDGRWFAMQVTPLPGRHSGALVVHTDISPVPAEPALAVR